MRIVLAFVPQLVFASFLEILFLASVFALVLAMYQYAMKRSRLTPIGRLAYESMPVFSNAIQPSVLGVRLDLSDETGSVAMRWLAA